jgi:predicted nucleic acid-binding protein
VPVFFLDTSALVKRYVAEAGSQTVIDLLSTPSVNVLIADITRAEFASAVNRRLREGAVSAEQHRALKSAFAVHLVDDYLVAPLESTHITSACDIIEAHGLRAYDAVQLAVALSLRDLLAPAGQPIGFVSADPRLNVAARARGFAVTEPLV